MTTPETSPAMPDETTHWAYGFADEVATTDCLAIGLVLFDKDGQPTLAVHSDIKTERVVDVLQMMLAVLNMGTLNDDDEEAP